MDKIKKAEKVKTELAATMNSDQANLATMQQTIATMRHIITSGVVSGEAQDLFKKLLALCDQLEQGITEAKKDSRKVHGGIKTAFVLTAEIVKMYNDQLTALETLDMSDRVVAATVDLVLEIMAQAKAS